MECIRQIYAWLVEPLVGFVSMLVGAAIGAHIAFKYQQYSDTMKERAEQITALKIAQGSIHSHWASLKEIHEFLSQNKSNISERRLNLKDLIRIRSIIPLDIPSIAFLFDGKYANLIQEVMLVEGASNTAIAGMKRRTELIAALHADSTNTRTIQPGEKSYRSDVDMVNGNVYIDLCESTEGSAREACSDAERVFFALKSAGEDLFGGKFLDLEGLPPKEKTS